ncbi:MAG: hypothetical protein AAFW87_07200 [Pseudomonadota bacterium]
MKHVAVPACASRAAWCGSAPQFRGGSFNFDRRDGQIIITGNAAADLSKDVIGQSVVNPVCAPNALEIAEFMMEPRCDGTNAVRAVCS